MFKLNRKGTRYRYRITLLSAQGLPEGSNALVVWKRGAKKANRGTSSSKPVQPGGQCVWNESVTIAATLFREGTAWDPKIISLTIKEVTFEVSQSVLC